MENSKTGNKKMQIVYKNIDELIPYINNPRFNDNAVDAVASSIKNFGFKNPIVIDSDNEIINGHTRLKAAKKLGLDNVPVIIADDLTEAQKKAFRLADNKVSEIADWDFEILESELEELEMLELDFDMSEFGFDIGEVGELFNDGTETTEDDFDEEPPEESISKRGDIWQLGKHRLMCGDSTGTDVDILVEGKSIDMLFTDPPYNIDYKGVKDDRQIMNDKMSDEDFTKFISEAIGSYPTMYVCCSWQFVALFKKAMENNGVHPKAMIVWDKINPAQHLDKYFKRHELILYYGEFGGHKTLRGDVWQLKRQRNTLHPTMKPIELIAMAIEDNPKADIIYDAFGGSGSTLIACEQLDRICYMMELDEKYVDVIVNRYIDLKESSEDVFLIRDGTQIPYKEVEKNE